MPSGYHPLTHFERGQIHAGWHRGLSKREIARPLERDPTTMARETSRHCGQRGDRHQPAQGQAMSRRRAASAVPWKMTPEHWEVVEDRLQAGWSPDPIAGRFQQPGELMAGREWIDQSIRADRPAGGDGYQYLRHRGKPPNGWGGRPAGRGHLPGRVDIAERPADGGGQGPDRGLGARPGHRGDRTSKDRVLIGEAGKTAAVTEAIVRRMAPIRDRVHTGTADNGQEFARHREIAKALGADWDFATPDHSGERGLNEHTNGRVRQDFPKGTDFHQVTLTQVQAVEEWINRRPRKVLGVRTPQEVFTAVAPPGRRSFLPHLPPSESPCSTGRVPLGQHPSDTARAGAGVVKSPRSDSLASRWMPSVAEISPLGAEFSGRRQTGSEDHFTVSGRNQSGTEIMSWKKP